MPPPPSPLPPPAPLQAGPFEATFGDCVVTQNGHCFQTPNFPGGDYGGGLEFFNGMYDCEVAVSYPVSLLAAYWDPPPPDYFRMVLSPAGTIFQKTTPPNGEVVGSTGESVLLL